MEFPKNWLENVFQKHSSVFFPYSPVNIDYESLTWEILFKNQRPLAFMAWNDKTNFSELVYFYSEKTLPITVYFFVHRFYNRAKSKIITGLIEKK
jgi:hypothetical protein